MCAPSPARPSEPKRAVTSLAPPHGVTLGRASAAPAPLGPTPPKARPHRAPSTQERPRPARRKHAPGGASQKVPSAKRPERHAACVSNGELAMGRKPRAPRADLPALDITNIMSTCGGQGGGAPTWPITLHGACSAGLGTWRQAPRRVPARVIPRARSLPFSFPVLRTARQLRTRARAWSPVRLCASVSLARLRFTRWRAGCLIAAARRQPARQRALVAP